MRLTLSAATVAFAVLVVVRGLVPGLTVVEGDFVNYWVGSRAWLDGAPLASLYDDAVFAEHIRNYGIDHVGKWSAFPPATVLLMLPLAWLPPLLAKQVWVLASVLLLALHVPLIRELTGWTRLQAAAFLLAGGLSLANGLAQGQVYVALSLVLFMAWTTRSAWLVTLCAAVKIYPAVYLLFLRDRSVWLVLAGLALLGPAAWAAWLGLFGGHAVGELTLQSPWSQAFQAWPSLLRTVFVSHPQHNPSSLDVPLGLPLGLGAVWLLHLAALAASWPRASERERAGLVGLAGLALAPATATYHFVLLWLPVVLLDRPRLLPLYVAVGLSAVGPVLAVWGRLWLVELLFVAAVYSVMSEKRCTI